MLPSQSSALIPNSQPLHGSKFSDTRQQQHLSRGDAFGND
jgi:hypothetical protein